MTTTQQQQQHASFCAGDTVYTFYGAGVIVSVVQTIPDICDGTALAHTTDNDPWYTVRLWRLPNRSVGSAALAKLKSSAVRFLRCINIMKLEQNRSRQAYLTFLLFTSDINPSPSGSWNVHLPKDFRI
jgi:hypothetical protein